MVSPSWRRTLVSTIILALRLPDHTLGDELEDDCSSFETRCRLELGVGYGNPWLKASVSEGKYFEVNNNTAEHHPSEVITTVAYGMVEVYVTKGRREPTSDDYNWSSAGTGTGNVVRLRSWEMAPEGEQLSVLVLATSSAAFRILVSDDSEPLQLEDGIPVEIISDSGSYRHFVMSVAEPGADVSVSVSPYYGDPDLYMMYRPHDIYNASASQENATHSKGDGDGNSDTGLGWPTAHVFDWASISFGPDYREIQAEELSKHCIPGSGSTAGTVEAESCDLAISVLVRANSSYVVQASLNLGWENPRILLFGQAQAGYVGSGEYQYYKIEVGDESSNRPLLPEVAITITPTSGGDQDLYLTSSRDREPGMGDHDIAGASWAGTDTILFAEGAEGYCTNCTLYLGVYGFQGGSYSVMASQGLTRLQEGTPQQGIVPEGGNQYYSFVNPPGSSATVEISLTVLTGDPDLYIIGSWRLYAPLPGSAEYDWACVTSGDEMVVIPSSDPRYCAGCEYRIGVTSWKNSTFTIAASLDSNRVIALVHGRPQTGYASVGNIRYFSVQLATEADTLRLSLTCSTGQADMFVGILVMEGNGSHKLIDPKDPTTYRWTTKDRSRGTLIVPGPHKDATSFLIGVSAVTQSSFSIVATFSQVPMLLQSGVPQDHLVACGEREVFKFLVDQGEEDVQVTVTTIYGYPHLYAAIGSIPDCLEDVCSNWTWSTAQPSTETIFINHLDPCGVDPRGPNMLVSETCGVDSFTVGEMFLTVFAKEDAEQDTRFTVVASAVGQPVTLVSGMPQHGATTATRMCGAGWWDACIADKEKDSSTVVHVAFFTFQVSSDDIDDTGAVSIRVVPECPPTAGQGLGQGEEHGGDECLTGCKGCEPLKVFVSSCLGKACGKDHQYPSQGRAQAEFEVTYLETNIFVVREPDPSYPQTGYVGGSESGASCHPLGEQACVYYISVVAGPGTGPSISLSVTASTARGVTVLPCVEPGTIPDASVVMPVNIVGNPTGQKNYELCARADVDLKVEIEACEGNLSLLVCDSSCTHLFPSKEDYKYLSDGEQTCIAPEDNSGRPDCEPVGGDTWQRASNGDDDMDAAKARSVVIKAGHSDETFFVSVAGLGAYILRVEALDPDGKVLSPVLTPLVLPTLEEDSDDVAPSSAASIVEGQGEATVRWEGSTLIMQGEERDCGDLCNYNVYAIPWSLRGGSSFTSDVNNGGRGSVRYASCELERLRGRHKGRVLFSSWVQGNEKEVIVKGLESGEDYDLVVEAKCDFLCLEAMLPKHCNPLYTHMSAVCKTQSVVFPPATKIGSSSDTPSWWAGVQSSEEGAVHGAWGVSLWYLAVMGAVALVTCGGGISCLVRRASRPGTAHGGTISRRGVHEHGDGYELTTVRGIGRGGWGMGGGRGYSSLTPLEEYGEDEEEEDEGRAWDLAGGDVSGGEKTQMII